MGARACKCTELRGVPKEQWQPHAPAGIKALVGSRTIKADLPFVAKEIFAVENFEVQKSDVMIVTYPKCGTTWCQQLCHQLRTGGHTDFEEISEERIVPWLEIGPSIGINIALPQVAEPRCFKTHQRLSALSRFEKHGARFLCVLRDPEATLLSEFKFLLSKGAPGTESKDVNVFATSRFLPNASKSPTFGGNLWEFYAEFWRCRMLPNVRLVAFEDLKRDLKSQVLMIADFMGLPPPGACQLSKVLELGSFSWMQRNDHLFDDHHMGPRLAKAKSKGKGEGTGEGVGTGNAAGDCKGEGTGKLEGKGKGEGKGNALSDSKGEGKGKIESTGDVRTTTKVGLQVGDDVNLNVTEDTRALLQKAWREVMEPATGHATYQELINVLRQDCP